MGRSSTWSGTRMCMFSFSFPCKDHKTFFFIKKGGEPSSQYCETVEGATAILPGEGGCFDTHKILFIKQIPSRMYNMNLENKYFSVKVRKLGIGFLCLQLLYNDQGEGNIPVKYKLSAK